MTRWVVELSEPELKVRSCCPTFPSRRRLVKVAMPEPGVLESVPVIVALSELSTGVEVTVTSVA